MGAGQWLLLGFLVLILVSCECRSQVPWQPKQAPLPPAHTKGAVQGPFKGSLRKVSFWESADNRTCLPHLAPLLCNSSYQEPRAASSPRCGEPVPSACLCVLGAPCASSFANASSKQHLKDMEDDLVCPCECTWRDLHLLEAELLRLLEACSQADHSFLSTSLPAPFPSALPWGSHGWRSCLSGRVGETDSRARCHLHRRITEWLRGAGTSGGSLVQSVLSLRATVLRNQDHVQTAFQYLQGGRQHHLSGQHHSKEEFVDVQREPHMFQFVPIVSCPVTEHHCREPGSIHFVPPSGIYRHR